MKNEDLFENIAKGISFDKPPKSQVSEISFAKEKERKDEDKEIVIVLPDGSEITVFGEKDHAYVMNQIKWFKESIVNPPTHDWKQFISLTLNEIHLQRINKALMRSKSADADSSLMERKKQLEFSQIELQKSLGLNRNQRIEQGKEQSAYDIYRFKLEAFLKEWDENPERFYIIQCPVCKSVIQSMWRKGQSHTLESFEEFIEKHHILLKEPIPTE